MIKGHNVQGYVVQHPKKPDIIYFDADDVETICVDYDKGCIRVKLKHWTASNEYYGCSVGEVMKAPERCRNG